MKNIIYSILVCLPFVFGACDKSTDDTSKVTYFVTLEREGDEKIVLEKGQPYVEPGYYAENEFGIRHENLVVCKKAEKTSYGQFMKFEPLTLVPFDLEGIDPGQMEAGERKLLNQYHALVYEKISPYLNEEEKSWLKKATQEI